MICVPYSLPAGNTCGAVEKPLLDRKNSSLPARNSPRISAHLRLPPRIGMRQNLPQTARRGDVQVETGHAKMGKRRYAPRHGRPAGSVQPATLLPAAGSALSRPGTNREGRAGNFDKIPNNSVKSDKFTGFFDKFLKEKYPITYCNPEGYFQNRASRPRIWSQKKFFWPSRAFARICDELRGSPRISAQPPEERSMEESIPRFWGTFSTTPCLRLAVFRTHEPLAIDARFPQNL